MPTPMMTPALAGAGAMEQIPMLRAAAARAAVQRRKCSEIFLALSMFVLRAEESSEPYTVNICKLMLPATLDLLNDTGREGLQYCSVGEGRSARAASDRERPRPDRARPTWHSASSMSSGGWVRTSLALDYLGPRSGRADLSRNGPNLRSKRRGDPVRNTAPQCQ
jgi:hypothetical protein